MPLTPITEILQDARRRGYGVGCFNCLSLEMARGILKAAESLDSPVILSHAQVHNKIVPLDLIGPLLADQARRAKVPVAVMLDHGLDFDTVVQAMKSGFNSVMIDASRFPLEENIQITKELVRVAHALDIAVEGEIGCVSRPEGANAEGNDDASLMDDTDLYTNPQDAARYVRETGVDLLAIAFGTAHGVYLKKPVLDFQRVAQISSRIGAPLVMHGSSGLSDEDFQKAVASGITKINYYTNMAYDVAQAVLERSKKADNVFYHDLLTWGMEEYERNAHMVIGKFIARRK